MYCADEPSFHPNFTVFVHYGRRKAQTSSSLSFFQQIAQNGLFINLTCCFHTYKTNNKGYTIKMEIDTNPIVLKIQHELAT
jgi:hypothetical protein